MKFGPKYRIARRLGASVFEKTSGPKFAASVAKRGKPARQKPRSDFGNQLIEKQRVRFTYGITEKQFKNYVKEVIEKRAAKPEELLFALLESRLDNVVLRSGLAHTRALARQSVSHGHITVNGRKVTIPSYKVRIGDKIAIREGSKAKGSFAVIDEKIKAHTSPSWIKLDSELKIAEIQGAPKAGTGEMIYNLGTVLQFYKR